MTSDENMLDLLGRGGANWDLVGSPRAVFCVHLRSLSIPLKFGL